MQLTICFPRFAREHSLAVGRLASFTGALTATFALGLLSEAHAECKLEQISEFHVERVANSPIIDGEINGQPIRILLDTASDLSFLTHSAAHRLGLPIRNSPLAVGNGTATLGSAVVEELRIGQFLLKKYSINVVGAEIREANGVASFQLSSDFFSQYATEFDLSHGVVRLLQPHDCKLEQLAYWSASYLQMELRPAFVVDIKVNGKPQAAHLETGSPVSYITWRAAKELGVGPSTPGVEPAQPVVGPTGTPIPRWIGRFDSIEFDTETVKNAHLHIADGVFPGPEPQAYNLFTPQYHSRYEVILGSDFFQAHRIMVVPDQHAVLFTYVGGKVF
jgi:Aspartyl protease